MSANDKMVTVPRQWAQETVSAGPDECVTRSDIDLLSEALNQAAQQGQGEPVGWQFYQQGRWWNGDDRIKDHRKNTEEAGIPTRDVFARPVLGQGEPVAFRCIDPYGEEGSWYDADPGSLQAARNDVERGVFSRIELAYTHANLTDVAQLELEIEHLRFSLTMNDCASVEDDGVREENRELRAQLAEAQALLREVGDSGFMVDGQIMPSHEAVELKERVEAFVSASAEPSAPVEIDEPVCKGAWQLGTACGKCRRCKENPPT